MFQNHPADFRNQAGSKSPTHCNGFGKAKAGDAARRRNPLLHQQHLARAFDGAGQAALIMGGQAGVFAGQDAALVSHKLPEQIGVLEIQRVGGEINLRFRPGRTTFHRAARTTAIRFIGIGPAGHGYLISR